jgi:hypothetical protein
MNPFRILLHRIVLPILVVTLGLAPSNPAAATPPPPAEPTDTATPWFVFGLSPFLDTPAKDPAFRAVVRFLIEDAPLGSTVGIYDAFNLRTVTTAAIPRLNAFTSPKTRANQFRQTILDLKQFLAATPPPPAAPDLDFTGALRTPAFLDFLTQARPTTNPPTTVTLIGGPLHLDPNEPGFSMARGFFPSDAHLLAPRSRSVYGIADRPHALDGVRLHWTYPGDPWSSDLHREKITRFWALFLEGQGARLASLNGDLPTTFAALHTPATTGITPHPPLDTNQTRIEMLRVTRQVGSSDWITQDRVSEPAEAPPRQTTGPLKIGIRWQGDIDLDLYASPRPGATRLYFEHPRSPEGYYQKDHRSSPDRDYEFIEFLEPVDVRAVQAAINFYEGSTPGGPAGEIRVEFESRIYVAPFRIPAHQGNQGREGTSQAKAWFTIALPAILHLP